MIALILEVKRRKWYFKQIPMIIEGYDNGKKGSCFYGTCNKTVTATRNVRFNEVGSIEILVLKEKRNSRNSIKRLIHYEADLTTNSKQNCSICIKEIATFR